MHEISTRVEALCHFEIQLSFSLKLSYNQFFENSIMNKYDEEHVEFKRNIVVILPSSMPRCQFNFIRKTTARIGR